MPFSPDFFQTIVNVNFGGLWLAVYADALTANNISPADGACTGVIGGDAFDVFAGTKVESQELTSRLLGQDAIPQWFHFVQTLIDPFGDNIQGFRLINMDKLPSTFGPGVPVPGSVTITSNKPLTDAFVVMSLYETKTLQGKTSLLKVNTFGFPIPGATGGFVSETQSGTGSKTKNFNVNRQNKTISAA